MSDFQVVTLLELNNPMYLLKTSAPGGTGDVVGPASATDNAIARFDLTTGKLIQNSNAILTDAGALTTVGNVNGASPTEMSYLSGVTSNIQTQINSISGGVTNGTVTLNFGATSTDTGSILVTGLVGLTSTKQMLAYVVASDTTATNTANDHKLLSRWGHLVCEYTSSTSMTIYCDLDIGEVTGEFKIRYIII